MNTRILSIMAILMLAVGSVSAAAPYRGTTVGSPTVPPSSRSSGTYRSTTTPASGYGSSGYTNTRSGAISAPPSRYGDGRAYDQIPDYSYRMYNEGAGQNVNGSRYYGSDVPYRSSDQLNAPLGYGNLNSFLRNSSQYIHSRGYTEQFAPYYIPQRNSAFSDNRLSGSVPYTSQSVYGSNYNYSGSRYYVDEFNPETRSRPLQTDITDLELKIIRESGQIDPDLLDSQLFLQDQHLRQAIIDKYIMEQEAIYKGNRFAPIDSKAENSTTNKQPVPTEDPYSYSIEIEPDQPATPQEPIAPGYEVDADNEGMQQSDDDAQAEGLQDDIDDEQQEQETPEAESSLSKLVQRFSGQQGRSSRASDERAEAKEKANQQLLEMYSKIDHATARGILGDYESYDEYAAAKCDSYMQAGDAFLQEGKFYKAADSYALADIYAPDDPRPSFSMGIALFAAGEYLTSSRYIEKAISINAEYASHKIGISKLIDDETLDMRLGDLKRWYEIGGSAKFMFLVSYLYYQRGDAENALQALDVAAETMEGQPSVTAMRKAINAQLQAMD